MRIRTVKALTFLERAGFVVVDDRDGLVAIQQRGREVVGTVLEQESPLAVALLTVERSFENIRAERRIQAEAW